MSSSQWVPPKTDWQLELERLEKEKSHIDARYERDKELYLNQKMNGETFKLSCAQCDFIDHDIIRHKARKPKAPIDALRLNNKPLNNTLYLRKREKFECLIGRFNDCDSYINLIAIVRFVNLEINNN